MCVYVCFASYGGGVKSIGEGEKDCGMGDGEEGGRQTDRERHKTPLNEVSLNISPSMMFIVRTVKNKDCPRLGANQELFSPSQAAP